MVELSNTEKMLQCNLFDCRPPPESEETLSIPQVAQPVDYMARDYDSLLRGMLDLLPSRVPGWKDRTEADLGMALLELFAYFGDQLSYYQDRVANEAFLRSATQYESVQKLLRLIDYDIHPGLAAQALLQFTVNTSKYLPAGERITTRETGNKPGTVFETSAAVVLHPELNAMHLAADAPTDAERARAILDGEFDSGLLPENTWLYFSNGTNGEWLQIAAPVSVNTVTHQTEVQIAGRMQHDYPAFDSDGVTPATLVRGNGVLATQGESHSMHEQGGGEAGQTIALEFGPLTYTGGTDGKPVSSLQVVIGGENWLEVEDFMDSEASSPHYRTVRDRDSNVRIIFGDGERGMIVQSDQTIRIDYRVGVGQAGIVAAHSLTEYSDPSGFVDAVTNPLPSHSAIEPQSLDSAKFLGPQQLGSQNRAVTLADYERAVLALNNGDPFVPDALHARARFVWTGSWYTVVVSIELSNRGSLAEYPQLNQQYRRTLNNVKLSGYDIELESARYAALHIALVVNVKAGHFARQLRERVQQLLGNKTLSDGTQGFFAPGRFGFGDHVYLSDLYAVVMAVDGVESVKVTRFKRLGDRFADSEARGYIEIDDLLIARCDSDIVHPESGIVTIRTCGGKAG